MIGHTGRQMNRDVERLAARAAPAIFVVLWSTGFIGTKYVLHNAEPLTYLAIRMVLVVALMAVIAAGFVAAAPNPVIFGSSGGLLLQAAVNANARNQNCDANAPMKPASIDGFHIFMMLRSTCGSRSTR